MRRLFDWLICCSIGLGLVLVGLTALLLFFVLWAIPKRLFDAVYCVQREGQGRHFERHGT